MICPKCKEEGKKSTVQSFGTMTTLLGYAIYYDEEGKYHDHDPNTHTTEYRCSNGHDILVSRKSQCPNCDYGKDTENIRVS